MTLREEVVALARANRRCFLQHLRQQRARGAAPEVQATTWSWVRYWRAREAQAAFYDRQLLKKWRRYLARELAKAEAALERNAEHGARLAVLREPAA